MRIVLVGQGPFGEKTLDALIQNGEDIVGVFARRRRAARPCRLWPKAYQSPSSSRST